MLWIREDNMSNIRQTILIRTDLKLPTGLLTAQVAHIHMEKFRLDMLESIKNKTSIVNNLDFHTNEWLKSPYIFIHGVMNLEILEYYAKIAKEKDVGYTIWKDTIFVEIYDGHRIALENIPIGLAFSPNDSDKIKAIIGDLPLLK